MFASSRSLFLTHSLAATTSISFVVDVLFPYIEANVHSFVREHFDSLTAEFNLLQNQAELDVAAGLDGAAALPQQLTNSPAHVDLIAANVKWQMARNAKTTALKQRALKAAAAHVCVYLSHRACVARFSTRQDVAARLRERPVCGTPLRRCVAVLEADASATRAGVHILVWLCCRAAPAVWPLGPRRSARLVCRPF